MYWSAIDDIIYILLFFGVAVLLKRFIPILRKYLIPNSIIAGFIGFLVGPNLLNLVPVNIDSLGGIIYHLMAIGFISLSLRNLPKRKKDFNALNGGLIIVTTYLMQGILGFVISLIWSSGDSKVSPVMGLILPLGFGQGSRTGVLNRESVGTAWDGKWRIHRPGGSGFGFCMGDYRWDNNPEYLAQK